MLPDHGSQFGEHTLETGSQSRQVNKHGRGKNPALDKLLKKFNHPSLSFKKKDKLRRLLVWGLLGSLMLPRPKRITRFRNLIPLCSILSILTFSGSEKS